MREGTSLTRRQLIGSSLTLGVLAAAGNPTRFGETPERQATDRGPRPLAEEYSIAASVPVRGNHYMHDPGMVRLPSGHILVAAPCLERSIDDRHGVKSWRLFLSRSSDGGRTWVHLPTLPYSDATPFVYGGRLYMFIQPEKWKDVSLVSSDDEGKTWTAPVTLFSGAYWNCDTGMVIANGRLYWALNTRSYEGGVVVIAGDLSKDLLDPGAWRMSSESIQPKTPVGLTRGMYPRMIPKWEQWPRDSWLEPNVVLVGGRIRVLLRTVLDGYATAGICAVCDLTEDDTNMDLKFTQFYPIPGGQNKFFIIYDAVSRLFWMASNLVADSQESVLDWDGIRRDGRFVGGPGNDRRFLMLFYSIDSLNWFQAGCIAKASNPRKSFMYPVADLDGDDIVLISRTSVNGRDQHDADLVTFHRIRDFRSLALNLYPEF